MSKSDTWMPLYVGDYLADTGHLSGAEHGAYLLLLMHSWRTGPLPDDDAMLARIARTEPAAWRRMAPVIRAFFQAEGGRLVQARLERERAAASGHAERRADAARKAASARWQSHAPRMRDASDPHASGMRLQCPSPSQEQEIPPSPPSEVRSPRGSRLPVDWQPDADLTAFATQQGLDARRVAAQFRDYWHAKAGKDAVKLDWPATWRGWCRREAERKPSRAAPPANDRDWFAREVGARMNGAAPREHDGPLFDGHAEEVR